MVDSICTNKSAYSSVQGRLQPPWIFKADMMPKGLDWSCQKPVFFIVSLNVSNFAICHNNSVFPTELYYFWFGKAPEKVCKF